MAAPTFVAAARAAINSTSLTVSKPAGTADGDVMVAAIGVRSSSAVTPPSGWTEVTSAVSSPNEHRIAVFTKTAGASEPTSYTFTVTVGAYLMGVISTYRDASPTVHAVNTSTYGGGSSDVVTAPSVTTTVADCRIVGIFSGHNNTDANAKTFSTPTGMTERSDNTGTNHANGLSVADVIQSSAGSSGSKSATCNVVLVAWGGVQVALAPANTAPLAPTLNSPVGGATLDRTATQRFAWEFNDPNAGDSQSQYELRYRLVGASTWTTVGPTASPNTFHDFAGSTFAAGDYEWQARTWDAQGLVGPWSASETFTAADPPSGLTITDPSSGATIATEQYTVGWSAPSQDAYQLRRVADSAGTPDTTTVYFDTGTVESTAARSRTVEFETNGRWEHIQVRIRVDGLWSDWASVRVEISYTPPATPVPTVTTSDADGAIYITAEHPAPTGSQPTVVWHHVRRRETGDTGAGIRVAKELSPVLSWPDRTVASGVDYEYQVVAVGDTGTTAASEWTGAAEAQGTSAYGGY